MRGHKTNLNKFKMVENICSIFSKHKGMRLEINYENKTAKSTDICRLNNMLLNNQWVPKEIRENSKTPGHK